jgi:hypothetical protein
MSGTDHLEWWKDPWWRRKDYLLPHSVDEIERCVEILKQFLTASWLEDALRQKSLPMYAAQILNGKGYPVASFILHAARILEALDSVPGIQRKLTELKGPKSYAIDFELSVASQLVSEGAAVSFPKEGTGRTPDIVGRTEDESFAVECKKLGKERWEAWEKDLLDRLMYSSMTEVGDKETVIQVDLNPRLVDIFFDGQRDDINEEMLSRFEVAIKAAAETAKKLPVGASVSVSGVAKIRRLTKSEGVYGHVSGFSVSPTAKLRRIVRNGLLDAVEQLPSGMPGVVAIHSYLVPESGLVELVFDAICSVRRESMKNVVAMILYSGGTLFHQKPPRIYFNKLSEFGKADSAVMALLRKGWLWDS